MVKKYLRGFTLVELIIVVSIIAFLALLGMIYLRTQTFKGQDARRKADIKRIQVAIEEYEKDHNCYPPPNLVTCTPGTGLRPYLSEIPCDPITKASYFYEYQDSTCSTWYRIYSKLNNEQDSDITANIGPLGAFNYYQGSPNAPAPSSGSGGSAPETVYYGCKSGACVPITWDIARPGPECDPNYQNSTCYGQCGPESTECLPWR